MDLGPALYYSCMMQGIGKASFLNRMWARREAPGNATPSSEFQDPADTYEASQGIGTARAIGAVKKGLAKVALIGFSAGAIVAAVSSPPLIAGALLIGSGVGAAAFNILRKSGASAQQESSLQTAYLSTHQTQTTREERAEAFRSIEESLAKAPLSRTDDGEKQRGTRKAQIRTSPGGISYLWKAKESGKNQLRRNVPPATENNREIAGYLVDKRLGHYARVPPTIENSIDGEKGITTFIVGDAKSLDDASGWLIGNKDTDAYRRMAIFDQVIGNLDRHNRNFLTTDEGRIVPIDHGLAFPTKNGFQGSAINYAFSKKIKLNESEVQMLKDFGAQKDDISQELSSYLEPQAIDAMFERVEQMVEKKRTTSGWRWSLTPS